MSDTSGAKFVVLFNLQGRPMLLTNEHEDAVVFDDDAKAEIEATESFLGRSETPYSIVEVPE